MSAETTAETLEQWVHDYAYVVADVPRDLGARRTFIARMRQYDEAFSALRAQAAQLAEALDKAAQTLHRELKHSTYGFDRCTSLMCKHHAATLAAYEAGRTEAEA